MRLHDLAGKCVAVWGLGDEGISALRALAQLTPLPTVTVYTDAPLGEGFIASLPPPRLTPRYVHGAAIAADILRQQVVIKSPGVSLYRDEITAAQSAGVAVTSTVNLWFAEPRRGTVIAVTGSKGKSTTSALIAHLWRKSGKNIALAGNMRVPLLEMLPENMDYDGFVLELSSYQCANLTGAPDVGVLINLYEAHQEWHRSHARYCADKLRMIMAAPPGGRVLNYQNLEIRALSTALEGVVWFNQDGGWQAQADGLVRHGRCVLRPSEFPVRGQHQMSNLAAAVTALELVGVRDLPLAESVADFAPLPHRIQELGVRAGRLYVNDSIATIPEATQAAVECYPGRALTLLLGGKEAQQDYAPLAAFLAARADTNVICFYETGVRARADLEAARAAHAGSLLGVAAAEDLAAAVALARRLTPEGGVVLLSPGAASYDAFRNFEERGKQFAELAGFVWPMDKSA